MGNDFKDLNEEQLQKKLKKLNELLEDTEEVREIQVSQTGQHLYASVITKLDQEIAEIKEDIETVKGLLDIED